jgi:uncharacterized alkaline shock family protein YloU
VTGFNSFIISQRRLISMTEAVKKTAREDKIRISDEVVMTIAGIAASQVEGVSSMSGSFGDGIAGILGRKNPTKGVKVEVGEKEALIDLSIVVEYGCKIHEVAREIQDRVRKAVEEMTPLKVVEVNVNVLGVNIGKDEKGEEDEVEGVK